MPNMKSAREQTLIDCCFDFALFGSKYMQNKSNEEIAEWVARNLRDQGFDTEPRGMSWGILK